MSGKGLWTRREVNRTTIGAHMVRWTMVLRGPKRIEDRGNLSIVDFNGKSGYFGHSFNL